MSAPATLRTAHWIIKALASGPTSTADLDRQAPRAGIDPDDRRPRNGQRGPEVRLRFPLPEVVRPTVKTCQCPRPLPLADEGEVKCLRSAAEVQVGGVAA